MKKYLVLVSLVFAACGSKDEEESGYASEYPESDKDSFIVACYDAVKKNDPTAPDHVASGYCLCMLEKLMENYSYDEFNNKPSSTMEGLKTHAQTCVNTAWGRK